MDYISTALLVILNFFLCLYDLIEIQESFYIS